MERVGEHPVPAGPLAVRWLAYDLPAFRAGAEGEVEVVLQNAGTATWRARGDTGVKLSYHWLDDRGNAIVWDGPRVDFGGPVAPGDEVEVALRVRAPQPPGRYRLAFDLVEELRFWFAEVGSAPLELDAEVLPRIEERRLAVVVRGGADEETTAALAAQEEPLVEADAVATAYLVAGAIPAPDWSRRILDAHAEGYVAVGGSIEAATARCVRGRPAAAAIPPSRTRCCCRRSSPGSSRASTRACPPTSPTASRRSSTDGSDFDCHAVVDAREDERAERERDDGRDREVDHVAGRRQLAEEDRIAERLDRGRDRIAPVDERRRASGCRRAPGSRRASRAPA